MQIPTMSELQAVVETEIRPVLQMHRGDITLTELKDGILHFRLTGGCAGCPSAWLTAEELVKASLMEQFPVLRDVVADTQIDDTLIQLAKQVLNGTFQPER